MDPSPDPLTVFHVSIAYGWRGGQHQTLLLMQGLNRLGHRSILLTPGDSEIARRAREADVELVPVPLRREFHPVTLLEFRRRLREYAPDVVHLQGPTRSYLGWYARHVAGVPATVITRRQAIRIRGPIKYRVCSDRVIAISHAVASVCRRSRWLKNYVDVAHDGSDVHRFQPQENARPVRVELGIADDELLLYTTGALDPCKDLETLLRAFRDIRTANNRVRLAIAGSGPLEEPLKDAARAGGLTVEGRHPEVQFLGFREDVPDLLSAADLYVQTSRQEGLCSSVIEAMLMEKPVLATRAGGIPELVSEGITGRTVEIGDANGLALAARDMLANRDRLMEMGRSGREVALREYTAAVMVEKNLEVYHRVMDRKPRKPPSV